MKEKEVIISVKSVSKKLCKDLKRSLYYGVKDIMKLGRGNTDELRKGEFWAVSDISFELRRGDCLGLIGHNGAGKSSLLKMLNGLISPDKGSITIKGRVGALIELGAGFNPILTGRENIFNNGAVLGFSKKEMEAKMQEIIDFSEIEEFIDMPVQNYSSGMKVRLGFAVAANLEPDLLLIDEVLAVGDIGFKIKCYNKIASLMETCAIILVSHSMPQVAKISSSILLLDKGKELYLGNNVYEGTEIYLNRFQSENSEVIGTDVIIKSLKVNAADAELFSTLEIKYYEDLRLEFQLKAIKDFKRVRLNLIFFDKELKPILNCFSSFFDCPTEDVFNIEVKLKELALAPSAYTLLCTFMQFNEDGRMNRRLSFYQNLIEFNIRGIEFLTPASMQLKGEWKFTGVEESIKTKN